jgi:hypothetical protein
MSKMRIAGFALLVIIIGTACGLPSVAGAPEGAGDDVTDAPAPDEAPTVPVPINQGLASLDSYRMTYTNDVFDSTTQERTTLTLVVASDRASDASHTRSETVVTAGDEVVSQEVEEQIVIGNQVCAVTDGEAEFTVMSDTARVMTDLMSQVVDFNPLIENPVFVEETVVNGVPVRTYTFELRSIGAASEVEAARADGSYAIAVDGEYLVDYRLDLDLRTGAEDDPEATSSVSFFDLTLEEINQPVEISLPANCLEAQSFAE